METMNYLDPIEESIVLYKRALHLRQQILAIDNSSSKEAVEMAKLATAEIHGIFNRLNEIKSVMTASQATEMLTLIAREERKSICIN